MGREEKDAVRRKRMRDRKVATITVAIVVGLIALYFAPLCVQYAENPSVDAALSAASENVRGRFVFALESERIDSQGRRVYRVAADCDPEIVQVLRYDFRWLPSRMNYRSLDSEVYSRIVVPPGPYYELINEFECREMFREWDESQERRSEDAL